MPTLLFGFRSRGVKDVPHSHRRAIGRSQEGSIKGGVWGNREINFDFVAQDQKRSSIPVAGVQLRRKCDKCREKDGVLKPGDNHHYPEPIPPTVHRVLKSSGQPLDGETRRFMESRFEHDFSNVRVHEDARASESARMVNALAYTVGHSVVFGKGQYNPRTSAGRELIAHELTHVVQQSYSPSSAKIMRKPPTSEPKWPSGGIQIIGSDKKDLLNVLNSCTGVAMSLDKDDMLVIGSGKPASSKGTSPGALDALRSQVNNKSFGIIVDTDPAAEAVAVGAFSHEFPGYQSIDVANIKAMAAASGESGGLDACSAIVHEMAEAAAGRKAAREGKLKGEDIFKQAHKTGTAVEEKIRTELHLPLRTHDSSKESVQLLGSEGDKKLLILESTIFGSGKEIRTQLTLARVILGEAKGDKVSGDYNVIASHVVKGEEKFSNRREAILVFNKYASNFGFKKLPVPEK